MQHTASDRLLRWVGFRRYSQGIGRYGNRVHRYIWTRTTTQRPDRQLDATHAAAEEHSAKRR